MPGQHGSCPGFFLTSIIKSYAPTNQKANRADSNCSADVIFAGSLLRAICKFYPMDISRQLRQPAITYQLREQAGKVIAHAYWQGKPMRVHIEIPEQPAADQTLFSAEVLEQAKKMHNEIRSRSEQ